MEFSSDYPQWIFSFYRFMIGSCKKCWSFLCFLSLFPLPVGVARTIERIYSNFLWDGKLEKDLSPVNFGWFGCLKIYSFSTRPFLANGFGGILVKIMLFGEIL